MHGHNITAEGDRRAQVLDAVSKAHQRLIELLAICDLAARFQGKSGKEMAERAEAAFSAGAEVLLICILRAEQAGVDWRGITEDERMEKAVAGCVALLQRPNAAGLASAIYYGVS